MLLISYTWKKEVSAPLPICITHRHLGVWLARAIFLTFFSYLNLSCQRGRTKTWQNWLIWCSSPAAYQDLISSKSAKVYDRQSYNVGLSSSSACFIGLGTLFLCISHSWSLKCTSLLGSSQGFAHWHPPARVLRQQSYHKVAYMIHFIWSII